METVNTKYSFNVSLYKDPPTGFENLITLVEMAQQRLNLYEALKSNNLIEIKTQLGTSQLVFLLKREHFSNLRKAQWIDYQSHWILRLAYSNMPETFIMNELEWFKIRFDLLEEWEQLKFIEENKFVFTQVLEEEKIQYHLYPETFHKFKFSEVPSLIKIRKYPLHGGYIYVPVREIIHWLLNKFENDLRSSLTFIRKSKLALLQGEQLQMILSLLHLVEPFPKYEISSPITLNQIDSHAELNFPLCMRFQHETLRKTHHLKYFSRMQYGLFLKGLGLLLKDTLTFWKDEFVQTMPEDLFWKKYSYLFKHQYGTVGNKINHVPYSCKRIMKQLLSINQIHGCPYKHWDEEVLVAKLTEYYGILQVDMNIILQLKSEEKYTEACAKCFECVHSCKRKNPIAHPNQYYVESCRISKELNDIEDIFDEDSE